MSDSPWRSPTSPGAEVARKPPNWGFYLLVNIGLAIVIGLADFALSQMAGFSLPSLVINIIVLVGSTWFAGAKWLEGAGNVWTVEDRKRLAFAYTMVNLVVTVVVFGLMGALVAVGGETYMAEMGLTPEMLSIGLMAVGVIMAIVTPLVLWAFYGIMRLVLAHIVGKGARSSSAADEFS